MLPNLNSKWTSTDKYPCQRLRTSFFEFYALDNALTEHATSSTSVETAHGVSQNLYLDSVRPQVSWGFKGGESGRVLGCLERQGHRSDLNPTELMTFEASNSRGKIPDVDTTKSSLRGSTLPFVYYLAR